VPVVGWMLVREGGQGAARVPDAVAFTACRRRCSRRRDLRAWASGIIKISTHEKCSGCIMCWCTNDVVCVVALRVDA